MALAGLVLNGTAALTLGLNGFTVHTGALLAAGTQNATISGTGTLDLSGEGIVHTDGTNVTTPNLTISSPLATTDSLVAAGTGSLSLNTSQSYTAGTTLNSGVLLVVTGALGTGAVSLVDGNLQANTVTTLTNPLTLTNSITTISGTSQITFSGTATLAGTNALTISNSSNLTTFTGNFTGSGSLEKLGADEALLSPATASTYSGGTVLEAGLLIIGTVNSALGTGPFTLAGSTVETTVSGGVTLANPIILDGSSAATGGTQNLTFTGAVSLTGITTLSTNALTVTTFGAVSGSGALTKGGSDTLVLSGNNSETGAITNDAAGTTLLITGTNTTGPVGVILGTVGGNGKLGSISAAANVAAASGTDNPGTSIPPTFNQQVASANFSNGGDLTIQIPGLGTAGANYDQLNVTGALTLGGTSTLTLDLTGLAVPGTARGVVLFGSRTGYLPVFNQVAVVNNPNNYSVQLSYNAGSIDVVVVPGGSIAPGPATATLAVGTAASTNVSEAISNFRVPTTGTYYVAVSAAAGTSYSLVITRSAAFNTVPNNTIATPQNIDGTQGVLGAIEETTNPVVPNANLNTYGGSSNSPSRSISPRVRHRACVTSRFTATRSSPREGSFPRSASAVALANRRSRPPESMLKIEIGYAATTVATVSSTFAANDGSNMMTVFNGLLSLSSSGTGTPTNPFDIVINVLPLFNYNPSLGDLLVDIFMFNEPSTTFFDWNTSPAGATARVFSASGTNGVGSASGTIGLNGLVTEFGFTAPQDWYSFPVDVGDPLVLTTSIPSEGPGAFANTLNPVIALYSPSGALVASGLVLADGRNQQINYTALATGLYRVEVIGQGNTTGEYFVSLSGATGALAPRVIATSVPPNAAITPGSLTYQVTFSKPMNVSSLAADDFTLHGNFVQAVGVNYTPASYSFDPTDTVLTLNYTGLPADNYTLTLLAGINGVAGFTDQFGQALDGEFSGTFPSGNGVAGGNFVIGFDMVQGTAAYPTPLVEEPPQGTLIYTSSAPPTGVITFAGDTDSFTLAVDAGQTISVLVTPTGAATLQPMVSLFGPSGAQLGSTAIASAAGQNALLQTIATTTGGTYTITVGGAGGTSGLYSLGITLNAALDAAAYLGGVSNSTLATAQALDASFISLPASASVGRFAVVGSNPAVSAPSTWQNYYSVNLNAGDTVTLGLKDLAGTGTTFSLLNSSGVALAASVAGPTNFDQVITDFPSVLDPGTYYLLVTGQPAATYDLVITKNAVFDTEPNSTSATAQTIDGTQGVLGAIPTPTPNTVVPNADASTETGSGNAFPFNLAASSTPSMRYQQIYSHTQFASGGLISAISFRRGSGDGTFSTSNIMVQHLHRLCGDDGGHGLADLRC